MIGRTLHDQYRIDKYLGEGASGTVFACWDLLLNQRRAVKIRNQTTQDGAEIERFLEEARKLASLDHPNIVRVYSCGVHENLPYIIMEYLEGSPLRSYLMPPGEDLLDEGQPKTPGMRLSLANKLELLRQVARGLSVLHSNGIIHHDLSPNNVFVLASGSVKLLDLGLAKSSAGLTTATREGYLAGTCLYVSPEQIDCTGTTASSEIFSFGVILYEFISGIHPFRAEHVSSILYNISHRTPPPLSTYVENCPPELDKLAQRCLEKEASDRPPDAAAVLEILDRLIDSPSLPQSREIPPPTGAPHNPYHNLLMIRRREDFFGRKQEIRTIFARLNATPPGSVSLVGDRKIGKSSLLNFIHMKQNREAFLQRPDRIVMAFLGLQQQKEMTLEDFVQKLLLIVQLELRGRVELGDVPPSLEGLGSVVQTVHDRGYRLVILLDEFEVITSNERFDPQFFSYLRHLANHYNVAYLTSSLRDLQTLCHSEEIADSPFFNVFQTMKLKAFEPDEARELIKVPSEKAECPLEPYTDQIIEMAGLFPFFLQIACSHAFEYMEAHPDRPPDFEKIREQFYADALLHYRHSWDKFDSYEKSVLMRVSGGRRIPKALEHVLLELSERNIITGKPERPRLFSSTFQNFVLKEGTRREKMQFWRGLLRRPGT